MDNVMRMQNDHRSENKKAFQPKLLLGFKIISLSLCTALFVPQQILAAPASKLDLTLSEHSKIKFKGWLIDLRSWSQFLKPVL